MKNLTLCFALSGVVALASCSGSGAPGATGVAGLQGPEGPVGPMGDKGDKGDTGNNGTMGNPGTAGVPGPTLYKRDIFADVGIPNTVGATASLKQLTFTAPVGTPAGSKAIVSGRGHCEMIVTTNDNLIDIHPEPTVGADLAANSKQEWGRAMVVAGSPGTPGDRTMAPHFMQMWSTETEIAVTAGTNYTMELVVKRTNGGADDVCSGTFFVQIYTGNL